MESRILNLLSHIETMDSYDTITLKGLECPLSVICEDLRHPNNLGDYTFAINSGIISLDIEGDDDIYESVNIKIIEDTIL